MSFQRIALHLTDRCQLDCQHCLRDPTQKPTDLSLHLIRHVLDQATQLYKIRRVSITGGEPTLHPEFDSVLDAIVAYDCQWDMVTNGKRFPSVLKMMEERHVRRDALRSLTLSLDGIDEATHDQIRGAGSFREVMAATTLCQAHGIRFGIQMVVHAINQSQIELMGLLAGQLGASCVSFAMIQPTGTLHDKALFLPASAWHMVVDRLERLATILKIPVVMPEGYPTKQPFSVCGPFRSETLHVNVHGCLTLCCMHSGSPEGHERNSVAGDLSAVSLPEAHRQLLGIIHKAQADKLAVIECRPLDKWEKFPCNYCLQYFNKPHWTEKGAAGPSARRERWVGAWSTSTQVETQRGERTRLPILV